MTPKQYRQLLTRVLAAPVAALALLAFALAFGLQRLSSSAGQMDHSDQLISAAFELNRIMVDEETAVRGYLLTQSESFLDPLRQAHTQVNPRFANLFSLVGDNPGRGIELQRIRDSYQQWDKEQTQLVTHPPAAGAAMNAALLQQKQGMDSIRTEWKTFIAEEQQLRQTRAELFSRLNWVTLASLNGLALLVAALLVFRTVGAFRRLTAIFTTQLSESRGLNDQSYEREQWLRTILRSIGDAVIACDADGRVVFMNPVAEQLTGWSEKEANGNFLANVFYIVNESTRGLVESPVDKVRRLGTVVGLANHTVLIRKNGSEVHIDDSGAPIRDASMKMVGVVLVFRDISEKRQSEQALIRAEKLASAGRLSASIAHEVNNPLEALVNMIYLARQLEDLAKMRSLLLEAETQVGRIAHITRQSLGFYKDSTRESLFSVASVVHEVASFYTSRATLTGVRVETRIRKDVQVVGMSGEIRQVLSNLLANALDATPEGGCITLQLHAATHPRKPSIQGARITLGDSGSGIEPESMKKIFEPFYTTKEATGTGLGLWVTRQLLEKHGALLRVRSCAAGPKTGTVFSLFLPAIPPHAHGESSE